MENFDFFATGKRVKKEEPAPVKSPLSSSMKWGMPEEKREASTEAIIETKKEEIRSSASISTPSNMRQVHTEEEIGNVGSELQKFRKYPQKKYDKLMNKMVLFNEEEYFLIRDLASEISMARKRSTIANKGSLPRITENTVIRAALKAMFQKIGRTNTDLSTLQTEEALENYFNSLLK